VSELGRSRSFLRSEIGSKELQDAKKQTIAARALKLVLEMARYDVARLEARPHRREEGPADAPL